MFTPPFTPPVRYVHAAFDTRILHFVLWKFLYAGAPGGYYFTMDALRNVYRSSCMIGIQVWLEHGDASREVIGHVVYTWVDGKNGLMVVLRFDASSLRSNVILEWIKSGLFSGISLGYISDVVYENGIIEVVKKTIFELSIVRTPHHKTCKIQFVGNCIPSRPAACADNDVNTSTLDDKTSDFDTFFDALCGDLESPQLRMRKKRRMA